MVLLVLNSSPESPDFIPGFFLVGHFWRSGDYCSILAGAETQTRISSFSSSGGLGLLVHRASNTASLTKSLRLLTKSIALPESDPSSAIIACPVHLLVLVPPVTMFSGFTLHQPGPSIKAVPLGLAAGLAGCLAGAVVL